MTSEYSEFKSLIFVKQTKIFRQQAIHCAKCGGRTTLQIFYTQFSLSALDSSKCKMFSDYGGGDWFEVFLTIKMFISC